MTTGFSNFIQQGGSSFPDWAAAAAFFVGFPAFGEKSATNKGAGNAVFEKAHDFCAF